MRLAHSTATSQSAQSYMLYSMRIICEHIILCMRSHSEHRQRRLHRLQSASLGPWRDVCLHMIFYLCVCWFTTHTNHNTKVRSWIYPVACLEYILSHAQKSSHVVRAKTFLNASFCVGNFDGFGWFISERGSVDFVCRKSYTWNSSLRVMWADWMCNISHAFDVIRIA